jgi:hypothetical protein
MVLILLSPPAVILSPPAFILSQKEPRDLSGQRGVRAGIGGGDRPDTVVQRTCPADQGERQPKSRQFRRIDHSPIGRFRLQPGIERERQVEPGDGETVGACFVKPCIAVVFPEAG